MQLFGSSLQSVLQRAFPGQLAMGVRRKPSFSRTSTQSLSQQEHCSGVDVSGSIAPALSPPHPHTAPAQGTRLSSPKVERALPLRCWLHQAVSGWTAPGMVRWVLKAWDSPCCRHSSAGITKI